MREDEIEEMMGKLDTPMDHIRNTVSIVGQGKPERAWILTDQDVWLQNPHYQGPPVPHPEDPWGGE